MVISTETFSSLDVNDKTFDNKLLIMEKWKAVLDQNGSILF